MLHRTVIAGLGVAAVAAVTGTVALAGSHGSSHAAAGPTVATSAIRTEAATVGGKSEAILTNAQGMPLYYFASDTPAKSAVSGGLAALWPPVTSMSAPSASGLTGTLTVVRDSHGSQVAYNGHLLYTFVSDRSGVVTGQGVQSFFVATPSLSAHGSAPSAVNSNSNSGMYGGGY